MAVIPTNVGGLRAVELTFRPLRDIASGRSICYISRTQLNTPKLGTLMPETFRPAAESSGKSSALFSLELVQLAESIRALNEADRMFNWVSIHMPVSVLLNRASGALFDKICEQFSLTPNLICFALPEQVLVINNNSVSENIARLRRRGYHVMQCGFGENGCPFLKLSELPVDYVMLSPFVTKHIGKNERTNQAVNSVISFINDLGCEPVADGVQSSTQAGALYEYGCNFCAGPLSGGFVPLRKLTKPIAEE